MLVGTIGMWWAVSACAPGGVGEGAVFEGARGPFATSRAENGESSHVESADSEVPRTPPPPSGTPACGSLLVSSTRLTADIGPCAGDGVRFGDHDLTLDCDGHAIRGTGAGRGVIIDSLSRVTVKNCRIEGFATGIASTNATASRFLRNTLVGDATPGTFCARSVGALGERYAQGDFLDCRTALYLEGSANVDVEHNDIVGGTDGVVLGGINAGHRVRENDAHDVGLVTGSGAAFVLAINARGNRFDDNAVHGGAFGFVVAGDDAVGNFIERNHVEDVQRTGMILAGIGNLVRFNVVERAGEDGFAVSGYERNVLDYDEAWDCARDGFSIDYGATRTLVDHSRACGSGRFDRYDGVGSSTNAWIDSDFCTEGGL